MQNDHIFNEKISVIPPKTMHLNMHMYLGIYADFRVYAHGCVDMCLCGNVYILSRMSALTLQGVFTWTVISVKDQKKNYYDSFTLKKLEKDLTKSLGPLLISVISVDR